MKLERRGATRYNFGAIAEVSDLDSQDELVAITRDLSLSGCFVQTPTPFSKGTEIRVRIRHSGADFTAIGKVTGNITWEGMGIEFVQIAASDQAVIEEWPGLTSKKNAPRSESSLERPRDRREIRGIPVTVSGQLTTGEFSEETETQVVMQEGALLHLSAAVSAGQVVRLKNRLTRMEQNCRVLFVDPQVEQGRPKLLAVEFLEPAPNFWGTKPE